MKRTARCWKGVIGPKGARIMVRERTPGGPVYLFAYDKHTGAYRKQSLGFRVRDAAGVVLPDAVKQAKRAALELSNRLLTGERPMHDTPALTLGALIDLFEREWLPRLAPRTQDETRRELDLWRNYLGSAFVVSRIDATTWTRFQRERSAGLIDGHGKPAEDPRPVKARSVARALKMLRQLCRLGMACRRPDGRFLLDADPTRGLEIGSEPDPKRPMMTEDRYGTLLDAADARLRPILVLARETGRRITAICSLRWDDWQPKHELYGRLVWRGAHDKIKRTWTVPVTATVRDALQGLPTGGEWIFPHPEQQGRPLTREITMTWLRTAERHAGLSHDCGGFHAFRRLWASERKHLSLRDVAYVGGWKDTSTLLNVYQQPDPETIKQVVEGGRPRLAAVAKNA